MSEIKINAALVSAYLACGVMPRERTAFEGVSFTPPAGQSWARITDMPSGREPAAFGGANPVERTGILQVDLFHPKNTGTGPILTDVDKAMSFYTPGKRLDYEGQKVLIRKAERAQLRTDGPWQSIAISIYYTAWIFPG